MSTSWVDLGELPKVFRELPHARALIVLVRLETRQHAFAVVEVPSGAILAVDGWYRALGTVSVVDARSVAAETGSHVAVRDSATVMWLGGPLGDEFGPSLVPELLVARLLASEGQPRLMLHVTDAIVGAYIPLP